MNKQDHIEDRYRLLIYSYLSGQLQDEEKTILLSWLKESDEHKRLFNEFRRIYELSSGLSGKNRFSGKKQHVWHILNEKIEASEKTVENYPQTRILNFYFRRAASIIIIFSIGALASFWFSKKGPAPALGSVNNEIIVPLGGKSELVLPDGTKVWLNAGSRFSYKSDYGFNNRNVKLEGEAYFSVIKNPKKPFIVETSGLKIKAYGTSFNVKAYPEEKEITTTLVEGIVKIEGQGVNISMKPKQAVIIEKKTTVNKNFTTTESKPEASRTQPLKEQPITFEDNIHLNNQVNTEIYTSWKDNLWIIESASLKDIAKVLERKFNVNISIESPELYQFNFTGTFNKETLEQILNVLKLTAPMDYRINKGEVLITVENKRKVIYNDFVK